MEYYIYAIYNGEVDKIYIGQTHNIEKRLTEHNKKQGNHFTAKVKGVWRLIYKERCDSRRVALKRERELKGYQGRKYIKNLI